MDVKYFEVKSLILKKNIFNSNSFYLIKGNYILTKSKTLNLRLSDKFLNQNYLFKLVKSQNKIFL